MNVYSTGIVSSVSLDSNGDITRLFWGLGGPSFPRILAIAIKDPKVRLRRRQGSQNVKKAIGLILKLNNNFALAAHFVHFFAVTARLEYDVKCLNFLSLCEFGYGVLVLRNSTPGQFAYFWQCRWVEIISMKIERIIIIIIGDDDDDDDDDISKWVR